MRLEHHVWYSSRLGHDMGVSVFGHWGPPMLVFPTSHGDEWEMQRGGMIDALADIIEGGRVKLFCVGSNNHESFLDRHAHPLHRSWRQRLFDEYIRGEVVPFIYASCQTPGLPIATMGASLGAYHAANSLFRHPDVFKACYALSGIFDLRRFMDGTCDENFYFHNPMDYVANLHDPWAYQQLGSCDVRLVTGSGPWEQSHYSYTFSRLLSEKGIRHHLDDWGPRGGHDWPYWRDEMRTYLSGW